ncbi:transporter substrate-binding domain-containing protein, partial [Streptomyces sp. NPDC048641]
MTARITRRRAAAAVVSVCAAGMLVSACGDQTKAASDGGEGKSNAAPLADKLPKEIRDKGVITVGSDIAYAPVEFKDKSGQTAGIDPDLAAAMGKQLG